VRRLFSVPSSPLYLSGQVTQANCLRLLLLFGKVWILQPAARSATREALASSFSPPFPPPIVFQETAVGFLFSLSCQFGGGGRGKTRDASTRAFSSFSFDPQGPDRFGVFPPFLPTSTNQAARRLVLSYRALPLFSGPAPGWSRVLWVGGPPFLPHQHIPLANDTLPHDVGSFFCISGSRENRPFPLQKRAKLLGACVFSFLHER